MLLFFFQIGSTRLIAGVWYIFGLCILILYGIGLNSHVRSQVSGSRSQYTSLRQIINDPEIKLGVYCCGSTQAFLNVRTPLFMPVLNLEPDRCTGKTV